MSRTRKHSEASVATAIAMYKAGESLVGIVAATGISLGRFKDMLTERGVPRRAQGFQYGNQMGLGRIVTDAQRMAISEKHRASGHRPCRNAIERGQPKSVLARWRNHKKDPVGQLMRRYMGDAKKFGREFSLSREQFEVLVISACHYCGDPPSVRSINARLSASYNGVDRVDSSIGYVSSNCVAACKVCNIMKKDHSPDFFIAHCRRILEHAIVKEQSYARS